jgi:hypothetical protein
MKRAAPSVDWHLLSLERLEQHARDLKALGKSPTAAFTRALRAARRQREATRLRWVASGVREWRDTNGQGYRLTQNAVTGNVFIYLNGVLLNARYTLSAAKKYAQEDADARAARSNTSTQHPDHAEGSPS